MSAWVRPRWTFRSQLGNLLPAAILEWMQSLVDFCSSVVQVFPDSGVGSAPTPRLRCTRWTPCQKRTQGPQNGPNRVRAPLRLQSTASRQGCFLKTTRNVQGETRVLSVFALFSVMRRVVDCWEIVGNCVSQAPCPTSHCGLRVPQDSVDFACKKNHRETLCVSCWAFLFLTAMSKVLLSAAMLEDLRNEPVFKEASYSLLKRRCSVSCRRRWLPVTLNR